ncbi:uncharacterized protein LOC110996748 isoform X2 [Pieris rapae]|uniref:uncharacterized protein LOC110996748 isoform X2 n=1 Tax=Pieris rapae TaxID=64459 RepID=UPI001E27F8FE|nr:uncharacterized protein LOC110996748 isoform X2 [Pieris rapae]
MAQQSELLDFSGLFKLDVLVHLDIVNHTFYEIGLKKFLALSSDKELMFLYINPQSERCDSVYDWDFIDNPVYCMCFEPSGTWVFIVSDQKVLLVPFLPLFVPQYTFDCKWSLSSVTVLPLAEIPQPTSVVWWLTKESENIIIIGSKNGTITFYALESQSIVGETKVTGEVKELQMCFDDSLDLLALLISNGPSQQWKLVLEHRSVGYNWLTQMRAQNDKDKKESFMSYIRQLSKDKITLLIQGGSKDENKPQTVEYVLKPMEYLPSFRKGSNNWALTAQYVSGRHFLTAFELNEGTLILESPAEDVATRSLRPLIKKDGQYIQGLWSQRLLYLMRKNELEVHSAHFSVIQGETLLGAKRDPSGLWAAEVIGDVHKAYLMSAKEPSSATGPWKEPTFVCDLRLPRFILEPCLVITSCGAYVLNTVSEPCEWLVGLIVRGGGGAERSCAALGAPVPTLLRASADLLMSRGKVAPAHYLYSLSQSQPDGWIARLGVFGHVHELSMYRQTSDVGSLGDAAVTAKLLALLLRIRTNSEEKFEADVKFTNLGATELAELTCVAAATGLWDLAPVFSVRRGRPELLLAALKARGDLCRGALACLLRHRCLVPLLLAHNAQWLFDFVVDRCDSFDTILLKRLCVWLNPLQDQLRPVMRDLREGITSVYTTRMLQLISTFVRIVCALEARLPRPEIGTRGPGESAARRDGWAPRRALACGLGHWAVVDEGKAKVMIAQTPVDPELVGRVTDVACGRHHTLLLTENGIYSAGDNSYGQLGVGGSWAGGVGDSASANGALTLVTRTWDAPLTRIAAGHYHSAAVDSGGRLYTWGWGVHGQLCLGSIDDHCVPQPVTKFRGRKVVAVGCGACHTVVLMMNGEVWAAGAGVFGQLGTGGRDKSSVPLRVALASPAESIAAGYFHNLALTAEGLWLWGASPQQVRAAHTRRSNSSLSSSASPLSRETHLVPQLVDTQHVRGRIVQISAGWHHSCIMTHAGAVYTWGLNFDGQLGSGDRKQVHVPTQVAIRPECRAEPKAESLDPEADPERGSGATVACGGDFTVYLDRDGRIYATGNMHSQGNDERESFGGRVVVMKTTRRVIKIPASRNADRFLFHYLDRIESLLAFDPERVRRGSVLASPDPLVSAARFRDASWADDLIVALEPWIDRGAVASNPNVAAKLALHSGDYAAALRHLLADSGRPSAGEARPFLTHREPLDGAESSRKRDELKIVISSTVSKRIKEISTAILNEEPPPAVEAGAYRGLPCRCDETKYLRGEARPKPAVDDVAEAVDASARAARIVDECMTSFPVDAQLWETCFGLSRDFFLKNDLSIERLEAVLRKSTERNAPTLASAVLFCDDCAKYDDILTPNFYLNVCSEVLDAWG